jgi:hypothetical protein
MMGKQFKLYVMDFDWVSWSEYGGLIGIVAEGYDDAYHYLVEWNEAYGDADVPESELREVLTHAKKFDILCLDQGMEAGVTFQFIT